VSPGWAGTGRKRINLDPAAASLFKFEYEVKRKCVDRASSSFTQGEIFAGDAPRLRVDPNRGFGYKLSTTWVMTAKDKQNAWTGKHRITVIMSDSDPSAAQFSAEIADAPGEVE
jgi:hypothetical protein